ncbi:MAG TPA: ABC transporter substrate-binding protein [Acidimicrobiales bacterium]|nr:ABC transporter substrate-binding protein [Acidimicrobiales bacterium]
MDEHRRIESLRHSHGELESELFDEYLAERISRRELLRRAALLGVSLPLLGSTVGGVAAAAERPDTRVRHSSGKPVRVGIITPTGAINPLTIIDQGGLDMLGQTGEYLCLSNQNLILQPVLATKWTANAKANVWTFSIRKGVKFNNGAPLTADDVVYTFQLHTNKKNASAALSAFEGVLSPSGVRKVDSHTVAFHLEAPNGNFPYLCSSDNYNMIILPNGYDPTKWESSFVGTGPWVMKSYTAKVGATFTPNPNYWGAPAKPSEAQFTFFATATPSVLALEGGTIDVLGQFAVQGGEALLTGNYNVITLKSSAHRELSMRCDQKPFNDPRVRQAIALTLDRPAIANALFKGKSGLGNDTPFAPVFPSTVHLAQRKKNLGKAKSLLSAAGHGRGFSAKLYTEEFLEIPDFAQIIKQSAAAIGVNIALHVEPQSAYYGKGTFGNSDWLDGEMSLVDYGHRAVPNVFLGAPLESSGTWNAAHFKDPSYDRLVAQYVAAVDLSSQRTVAKKIETLLLNETPIVYAYFYDYLSATAKNVSGAYPTAIGHIFVNNCTVA